MHYSYVPSIIKAPLLGAPCHLILTKKATDCLYPPPESLFRPCCHTQDNLQVGFLAIAPLALYPASHQPFDTSLKAMASHSSLQKDHSLRPEALSAGKNYERRQDPVHPLANTPARCRVVAQSRCNAGATKQDSHSMKHPCRKHHSTSPKPEAYRYYR